MQFVSDTIVIGVVGNYICFINIIFNLHFGHRNKGVGIVCCDGENLAVIRKFANSCVQIWLLSGVVKTVGKSVCSVISGPPTFGKLAELVFVTFKIGFKNNLTFGKFKVIVGLFFGAFAFDFIKLYRGYVNVGAAGKDCYAAACQRI